MTRRMTMTPLEPREAGGLKGFGFTVKFDELPPNPGSDAAIDQGCTCPVIDNHHGHKAGGFWIAEGCPLHDPSPKTAGVGE